MQKVTAHKLFSQRSTAATQNKADKALKTKYDAVINGGGDELSIASSESMGHKDKFQETLKSCDQTKVNDCIKNLFSDLKKIEGSSVSGSHANRMANRIAIATNFLTTQLAAFKGPLDNPVIDKNDLISMVTRAVQTEGDLFAGQQNDMLNHTLTSVDIELSVPDNDYSHFNKNRTESPSSTGSVLPKFDDLTITSPENIKDGSMDFLVNSVKKSALRSPAGIKRAQTLGNRIETIDVDAVSMSGSNKTGSSDSVDIIGLSSGTELGRQSPSQLSTLKLTLSDLHRRLDDVITELNPSPTSTDQNGKNTSFVSEDSGGFTGDLEI